MEAVKVIIEPLKKVVVTGDPYSSLKLIQSLKREKEVVEVNLCERRAQVQVKQEQVLFYYIPHWQPEQQIERGCYESDAFILVVHDGCYESLPCFESVYDVFKKVNDCRKLIMVNDEPTDEKACEKIAKEKGADYIPLPVNPNEFSSALCKIASKI